MRVFWTPTARITYLRIIEYLEEKWTNKEVNNFISEVEETIVKVRSNPNLFPSIKKKNEVHRVVIMKHNSMYYRVKTDQVEILAFWDNRRNPKKRPY